MIKTCLKASESMEKEEHGRGGGFGWRAHTPNVGFALGHPYVGLALGHPRSSRATLLLMATLALMVFLGLGGCGDDSGGSGDGDASVEDASVGGDAGGGDGGAGDGDVDPDGGGQPSDLCFTGDPEGLESVELTGTYSLGEFNVTLGPEGGISTTHDGAPSRVLFESPAGSDARTRSALRLTRTELTVHEHQGSFEVEEEVDVTCAEALRQEVRYGDGVLVLSGGFGDGESACGALGWEMQLCEAQAGHLAFRVTSDDPSFNAVTLRAGSVADEHIFGMGEQFPHDTLNLKGRSIPVLSQEGGVGRGHAVISPAVNAASPGSAGSEESTYYAAPHFITSRLRSLFLQDTEYAVFDFTQDALVSMKLYSPQMTGRVLYGASPLELVERFTDYAGRMPPLPDWVNQGAVVALAQGTNESAQIVDDLLSHGAEIAAVWNQTWSGKVTTYIGEQVLWNWVQSETDHPYWDAFVDDMESQGIRVLCYLNPMFVDVPPEEEPVSRNLYQEGLDGDYFVRDATGGVLLLPVTAFDVALLDLTNEDARAWMKEIIQDEVMTAAGCSGWMVDFAEALPFDATLHSGVSAATYHNRYPVEWMRLNREAVEEVGGVGDVLLFNRSGSARTPAYSLLLWEGDQLTTWDKYDGLVSALHGILSGGFSGIALNHSDTGGYTSLSQWQLGYEREAEMLKRWTEMNAFTAVLRTHEGNQPDENEHVYTDTEAMEHFARFTKVYKALAFYRTELFNDAWQHGWPLVRHLWMHYPEDEGSLEVNDQFLLGSEILVAPIKNKCWTPPVCPYDKEVYFPPGEWVHLWSGDGYGDPGVGTTATVGSPIGEPAVFYRKGSAVGVTFVQNLQAAGLSVADPPL